MNLNDYLLAGRIFDTYHDSFAAQDIIRNLSSREYKSLNEREHRILRAMGEHVSELKDLLNVYSKREVRDALYKSVMELSNDDALISNLVGGRKKYLALSGIEIAGLSMSYYLIEMESPARETGLLMALFWAALSYKHINRLLIPKEVQFSKIIKKCVRSIYNNAFNPRDDIESLVNHYTIGL